MMGPVTLLLLGVLVVVIGIIGLRWHPFIALTVASLTVAALTPSELLHRSALSAEERDALYAASGERIEPVPPAYLGADARAEAESRVWFVTRFTRAFGEGCGNIALIIAMAAVIGRCLLDSGAARRIVDSLIRLFGIQGTPFAFAASAFTLGIPVFFDTVFYLLMPLGKAMCKQTGKHYLLYILTIVAGATMAHSLVPPTPGPLTVAGLFDGQVSVGSMMMGGLVVGVITVSVGISYAYWADRRWVIPLREEAPSPVVSEERDASDPVPSLWFSLLPIVLPVVLIAGEAILSVVGVSHPVITFLGDKNIALLLSAATAVWLLVRHIPSGASTRQAVEEGLASGGMIILITSAGSAFGAILKDTDIAAIISSSIEGSQTLLLIPVAYLVTALIRTAQGSATVAMITAGGMVAPLAMGTDLSYSALYLALAIGCGSKPISWANDSGFWLIGRMSGMTPMETFKSVSVMMILMSLAGLAVLLLGAVFLPLV
ncbi:MAG: GntP family permease [Verrucomicrobiaceae bacterium]|nr:GntP family permease [Verrucomicrobiaceae bacterium]